MHLLGFMRTNSPTSARHEDGLGYTRIWATPHRRIAFWDDAQVLTNGTRAPPRRLVSWEHPQ